MTIKQAIKEKEKAGYQLVNLQPNDKEFDARHSYFMGKYEYFRGVIDAMENRVIEPYK